MQFQNDDHKQVVLGSLLGNGFICKGKKTAYFCMRHSIKQLPWLQAKAVELQPYQSKTPWHQSDTTYTWRSVSDVMFDEVYEMCYPDKKKTVSMKWLDQMRALGLAVWYGDSGCLVGRGNRNACLRTQSFREEGNKIIEQYFNEVGIPCNVNKSRNSWVIVFTVQGSEILSKIIAPHLPRTRHFRLVTE